MKRPNLKLVFGWNMYVKKPKFKYLFSLIKKKKKKKTCFESTYSKTIFFMEICLLQFK